MPKAVTDLSRWLTDSHRVEYKDQAIREDVNDSDWSNLQLTRAVAMKKRFKGVKFSNTTFDNCYFRDSYFENCDFTGAKFLSTNLHGSKFRNCKFDYATFERTLIDRSVLADNSPLHENLRMRFARSLRMNYQQIGDAPSANFAIQVELRATEVHLLRSWLSSDDYYRKKYFGPDRFFQFVSWSAFKLLDFIWGNGEKISSLLRSVAIVLMGILFFEIYLAPTRMTSAELWATVIDAPQVFLGIKKPNHIPEGWLSLITIIRFIALGLFMTILVKRFNRR